MRKKRKPVVHTAEEVKIRLPNRKEGEMFGIVTLMTGAEYIKVLCEDGVERPTRIPGKLRKRVWIKDNDIVIVKPWEYEPSKADVVYRYLPLQVEKLKKEGHLDKLNEVMSNFM